MVMDGVVYLSIAYLLLQLLLLLLLQSLPLFILLLPAQGPATARGAGE